MGRWDANRTRFKRSQAAERRSAAALGGRPLPRSGGVRAVQNGTDSPTLEGDFRTRQLHAEHKRTEKDRMSVELAWFEQVVRGASRCSRTPAVVLLFECLEGRGQEWVFLPFAYFQTISGCATDPESYHGSLREVSARSMTLYAADLDVLARTVPEGKVPTLALVWNASPVLACRAWVGVPRPDACRLIGVPDASP